MWHRCIQLNLGVSNSFNFTVTVQLLKNSQWQRGTKELQAWLYLDSIENGSNRWCCLLFLGNQGSKKYNLLKWTKWKIHLYSVNCCCSDWDSVWSHCQTDLNYRLEEDEILVRVVDLEQAWMSWEYGKKQPVYQSPTVPNGFTLKFHCRKILPVEARISCYFSCQRENIKRI